MAENVSKSHLVDALAEKHGISKKDVRAVMDGLFEHIALHLNRGDKVQISSFGTFEIRDRQARTGVKPGTSEKISIPASRYPAFKPGKGLKDSVNS